MMAEQPDKNMSLESELEHAYEANDKLEKEIDRLRAELAERDKAVPVVYVLEENGTIYPAESGDTVEQVERLARARYSEGDVQRILPLYTHPPRQAVPEWLNGHVIAPSDVPADVQDAGSEIANAWMVGFNNGLRWVEGRLTAAPEARSETVRCQACNGSGMDKLSPDNDVIGTATCSHCGGSGKAKPLLTARSEAEIQAEALDHRYDYPDDGTGRTNLTATQLRGIEAKALESWADKMEAGFTNDGATTGNPMLRTVCELARNEAARLREGEK